MPALFERTEQVYKILSEFPLLKLNPVKPQANMLHIHLPISQDKAIALRDKLATEHSLWIGNPQQGMLAEQSYIEWYVGDRLLDMADDDLRGYLQLIEQGCV
jgi:hypothetical protein